MQNIAYRNLLILYIFALRAEVVSTSGILKRFIKNYRELLYMRYGKNIKYMKINETSLKNVLIQLYSEKLNLASFQNFKFKKSCGDDV